MRNMSEYICYGIDLSRDVMCVNQMNVGHNRREERETMCVYALKKVIELKTELVIIKMCK